MPATEEYQTSGYSLSARPLACCAEYSAMKLSATGSSTPSPMPIRNLAISSTHIAGASAATTVATTSRIRLVVKIR